LTVGRDDGIVLRRLRGINRALVIGSSRRPPVSAPDARFQGSIPEYYHRFLGGFFFEPYAVDLVRRLSVHGAANVLELACGTGIATRHLRAALPAGAQLVATDLNPPMIEYARANLAGADVHWRTADAQALPFKDRVFDAVVFQFGWMFLPDKAAGAREVRRVLRDGGTLLANVWCSLDDNPAAAAAHRALRELFPVDPPTFLETPFGFHDPKIIEGMAREAGFARVEIERVEVLARSPSARHVATGMTRGSPLALALEERGADLDAVTEAIGRALWDGDGAVPFATPVSALVITAS
jgi:SAM-dependent methyltransferase